MTLNKTNSLMQIPSTADQIYSVRCVTGAEIVCGWKMVTGVSGGCLVFQVPTRSRGFWVSRRGMRWTGSRTGEFWWQVSMERVDQKSRWTQALLSWSTEMVRSGGWCSSQWRGGRPLSAEWSRGQASSLLTSPINCLLRKETTTSVTVSYWLALEQRRNCLEGATHPFIIWTDH